jgi:hypothetical protein|tara:strand:- start:90 stop:644 length:555 start_codon:yes stop_codon:yes gene_type:complete
MKYNWVKYETPHDGVGTHVSVFIDENKGLVKRVFDGEHCGPGVSKFKSKSDIFFKNEVYWLTHPLLSKSKFLPKLIDITEPTKTIIQKYYGPNLLDYYPDKFPISNLSEQILEMYTFFTEVGVNKLNGALSNMSLKGDQVIAFDFKWARPAPKANVKEIKAFRKWLTKLDPELVEKLITMKASH